MSDLPPTTGWRVGWGFDSHRLDGDPPLILGGQVVSESIGVSATSDGDVLAHAITDAVLGACSLGDLGTHFPSDDPALVDADSMMLLRQVATMAIAAGWRIAHVDATVVAEHVRVAPYRERIISSLAETLAIDVGDVSVKATSTDGIGFTGRGEGLAATAVVTVEALS
ncbi:MAG: 2-C-methyl-D-erythritol 2,4-cyclodiphosphate synthase [Acidimicrobiia bacterium]